MIFTALPLLNEEENIRSVINCILSQTWSEWRLFVCINQPDEWWDDPGKNIICEANKKTFDFLSSLNDPRITIIDKFSRGNGWKGKCHGVGWGRKTIFDEILKIAGSEDLIISLDGDTTFNRHYFESVAESFARNPQATGMAVPYFHRTGDDMRAARAILRYEIYMRHYSINLWRIGSPYTFTALGSAMACRVRSCRAIGGLTPKMSGEDFYFLQKLRKHGPLIFSNTEKVYPAARFSDRVYFGTGPAMIRGDEGNWESYPVYQYRFFDEIEATYRLFSSFFDKTAHTPVTLFMSEIFSEDDPFGPLRKNSKSVEGFVRACHEKFDGLRVLQYLKKRNDEEPEEDEISLKDFLKRFYGDKISEDLVPEGFSFSGSDIASLERIRMFLAEKEGEYQISSAPV